jgi:hypothetical protein
MPNHVFNYITIQGDEDDLLRLKKLLSMPQPIQLVDSKYDNLCFNFHSLITPDKSIWDEYNGKVPKEPKPLEESLMFQGNDWYDWNIRNWGTKWNAYDVEIKDGTNTLKCYLTYTFNTAWSPPVSIIAALGNKIRELGLKLQFNWEYEEEQGWGGEYRFTIKDGFQLVSEYDIPSCHQDYVDRDRVSNCMCSWLSDSPDDWFDDCPNKNDAIKAQQELVNNK